MSTLDEKQYGPIHAACASRLGARRSAELDTGLRNMMTHRRLCHAVLNPLTDAVFRRAKTAVKDLESYIEKPYVAH